MASVDDRIVRMEFDNAAFERKAATTISTLGKLNDSLKLTGASKGLQDIQTEANKFSVGKISEGIEGVSKKFLALSTIAITALAGITAKALDAGAKIASSFVIKPVLEGFHEYETNMGSIQTILANTASKGTNLEQVSAALDELNAYSDQTIYNFGQMAKNIGTFTAAGVDLETSTASIKGIANIAAMSGSTSEQASGAMYQLSQAIATGSLKLMDWNSVVNSGMGGEAFKTALFETGKAMGTLTDVPVGQTFKEWEDGGEGFRASLEKGWITSEVLTQTLQGFTGDLTEAELVAAGYSAEVAQGIIKTAAMAKAAATEVKTFSQLTGTVKEAVATGWADSFKIVIGDFEEAKELWTGVNNAIGEFVGNSAEARNELLQGWKDMGGRTLLIESLGEAFSNLGAILAPIKEAFRDIFPPMTAQKLFELTEKFSEFAKALKPSEETVDNIRRVFKGLFSILEIGWTIIKQTVTFIGNLVEQLLNLGAGDTLGFLAKIGDFFSELNNVLVTEGGITKFFDGLVEIIKKPIPFLEKIGELIGKIFGGYDEETSEKVGASVQRLSDRFGMLKNFFEKVGDLWKPLKKLFDKVMEILGMVWEAIKDFGAELGQKLYDILGSSNFDEALDALNTALLGGIALTISRFLKNGLSLNINAQFESSGIFGKITKTLDEFTGVLSAMQANLKANTLLKIAAAIALITASVLTLSLIDSAALTKAMTAMSIGFGQLMGSFAIISKMSVGPSSAASLSLLSVGMTLMAGAILLLARAAKQLAGLSWSELAVGLTGITVMLGVMTTAAIVLAKHSGSMISSGVGIIAIAIGLRILANAVEAFARMNWEELARGMGAAAVGLGMIAVISRLLPPGMALQGIGILAIAVALNVLAMAVNRFADMSWTEMGRGFAALAGGLIIIAVAMKAMPLSLPIVGLGLLAVGVSLNFIAKAMEKFGDMEWGEIGRGLAVMAGALLILAVATNAMTGAIGGAIALTIVSAALLILVNVIKEMAKISWEDLLHGLGGIAAILATLAIAALLLQPALPALMLLGVALMAIGAGFALFGVGAMMIGKAFELLAKFAASGSAAIVETLKNIGRAIPAFVAGLAGGIGELAKLVGDMAPVIVEALVKILASLLEGMKKLIPKILEVVEEVIVGILDLIPTYYGKLIEIGIGLILALLQGIRDNIGEIVTLVGEIITEFLDAFTEQVPKIVTAIQELFVVIFDQVIIGLNPATLMLMAGNEVIGGFLKGMINAAVGVLKWFVDLGKMIIDKIKSVFGMASPSKVMMQLGVDLITGFFNGIKNAAVAVATWFGQVASKVISWIGNLSRTLWNKGSDLFVGLLNGIKAAEIAVLNFITGLPGKVVGWIGDTLTTLKNKGRDILTGLYNGLAERMEGINTWVSGIPTRIKNFFWDAINWLTGIGKDIIQGLWNGITDKWDDMVGWIEDKLALIPKPIRDFFLSHSPSRLMMEIGQDIGMGLQIGIQKSMDGTERAAVDMATGVKDGITNSLMQLTRDMEEMDEFNPVITPVLDLTDVEAGAQRLNDYIQTTQPIQVDYSARQANLIATSTRAQADAAATTPQPSEVNFEQNIYAPKQLSTSDIYKQTRNQITMAKEELSIP